MANYLHIVEKVIAPPGSTGNSAAGVLKAEYLPPGDAGYPQIGFQFVIEAVGATPTVTWKYQGSLDGLTWADITYFATSTATVTAASEVTATQTQTGTGTYINHLASPAIRCWRFYTLVVTSNTNVTYRSSMFYPSF